MNISIRLLQENELSTAEHIFRLAFGTFIGLPEPTDFCADANYVQTRSQIDPTAAFAAEVDGQLVGSNIAICWGSVGFLGPLSVHPDFWGRGVAKLLIECAIDKFSEWETGQAGLFTFPNSPKHHALYQKFGFYPRFLTFIMVKPIESVELDLPVTKYSELNPQERSHFLKECYQLTDAIYPGLDLSREILAVEAQNLGDTVLLWDDKGLAGFAVCHCGAGSEAGSDVCYVKFGAVRLGVQAGELFERLLDVCEAFGASQKMLRLRAGVNTSHDAAYTRMVDRHFRTESTGLVMHRPNDPGYNRPEVFVLDDWR
ncbi:MAG: GNAT family N-acetyltransferase [Microcoleus sp. PH2017_29_MFU_D_A]|uniref:GNAT family N-acetyltransferase n=1 Tax=unclassified Microcoleus TaxID=2642155 RepID=UPI001D504178|nr:MULTISPECIES: GNAT family N-acetyltransferase [unclassified Microcoleus]TAG68656.1 MAG: GNAT family N-acetyltransferase [Oscillatoriales cyanobacterium]MCC3425148.1 GNAT family N-acetyltransferase [Microcoleus sp. PH2017_01_SCD_O_A]MCC3454808.1 GNAT family N-acetyltransferase [Microcoleus sp. PH2017_08_TRC_O_A]MCC3588586.1 GNAT family N-acetyltransferase [Microcoleus sp. PH2017_30_WIL_O_A]MCC3602286.1 GNAT family N-acetyltransferase [Microcoleus sp. PH2017_29_MFU_D_A]